MTHSLIMSGTASGAAEPRSLHLSTFASESQFGTILLSYVASNSLTLDRFTNTQTFDDVELENVVVTELTLTTFANANTFDDVELVALPYDPENAETDALLAELTGTYSTTEKIQMDRLITELKDAGVWAKLDWYGNAYWAKNEHDALIDWTAPPRTLTKIGAAFWTLGQGLSGINPMINSGRYASAWDIGDGPHSTNTNFAMFCKITAIASPQNGMLPMGAWVLSSPGPSAPVGSFLSLSIIANTGFAGAYTTSGEGNTGFAVGDGLGVWVTSLGGGFNKTFKNGVQLDSDAVAIVLAGGGINADGICVAGSTGSGGTTRSFPGTLLYWGWSSSLNAGEAAGLESAFQTAILPPSAFNVTGALLINDDNDYLVDENLDYIVEDG